MAPIVYRLIGATLIGYFYLPTLHQFLNHSWSSETFFYLPFQLSNRFKIEEMFCIRANAFLWKNQPSAFLLSKTCWIALLALALGLFKIYRTNPSFKKSYFPYIITNACLSACLSTVSRTLNFQNKHQPTLNPLWTEFFFSSFFGT